MIEAILTAEIPVMGHLGLTPQSVLAMGGYRVQGRQLDPARELLQDALALAAAGVCAIVLEGIPDVLARAITHAVHVPTIGIGAGPDCDGQVLVFHDVLGLHLDKKPAKFVRPYAHLGETAVDALKTFFADIQSGAFPEAKETYHMDTATAQAFEDAVNRLE
jgi:3-methyl-2-oxobutanoate hydroxymethyltransferase